MIDDALRILRNIDRYDPDISGVERAADILTNELEALRMSNGQLKGDLDRAIISLSQKDAEITNLRDELDRLQDDSKKIKDMEHELTHVDRELDDIETALDAARERIRNALL